MKILPMYDRVLVKKERVSQTSGGIIIPETQTSHRSDRAVVVAVGKGKRLANGGIAEPIVRPGQAVMFDKNRGFPVQIDGVEHTMLFEDDIIAVCE